MCASQKKTVQIRTHLTRHRIMLLMINRSCVLKENVQLIISKKPTIFALLIVLINILIILSRENVFRNAKALIRQVIHLRIYGGTNRIRIQESVL